MNTKLMLVITRGGHGPGLRRKLLDADFRVTEFGTIGGFFRRKSTTLLIGLSPDRVPDALALIRETCPTPPDADQHNATVFVLKAGRFVHF
jgi:uncharacterized protein YaaQ